jgi:hypothetical protein
MASDIFLAPESGQVLKALKKPFPGLRRDFYNRFKNIVNASYDRGRVFSGS